VSKFMLKKESAPQVYDLIRLDPVSLNILERL